MLGRIPSCRGVVVAEHNAVFRGLQYLGPGRGLYWVLWRQPVNKPFRLVRALGTGGLHLGVCENSIDRRKEQEFMRATSIMDHGIVCVLRI